MRSTGMRACCCTWRPRVVAALAAIAYVRLFPLLKATWARLGWPTWARMALAGAVVGVVAVALPGVTGSGTGTMKDLFGGATIPLGTLVALAVAKLVLTPGSLGAGFVGGVIGPAMLIGSCVGGAVGVLLIPQFPDLGLSPVIFAMVGTTAMLSGSLHAPLFAALIVFEMAGVYEMLVPLMMAAAIGRGLAAPFQTGSVYTFGFGKLGIHLRPGRFASRGSDDPRPSATDAPMSADGLCPEHVAIARRPGPDDHGYQRGTSNADSRCISGCHVRRTGERQDRAGLAHPRGGRRQPQPVGRECRAARHRQVVRLLPNDARPDRRGLLAGPRSVGPLVRCAGRPIRSQAAHDPGYRVVHPGLPGGRLRPI